MGTPQVPHDVPAQPNIVIVVLRFTVSPLLQGSSYYLSRGSLMLIHTPCDFLKKKKKKKKNKNGGILEEMGNSVVGYSIHVSKLVAF
jgi:ABC-type phosphate transport system permease subunit